MNRILFSIAPLVVLSMLAATSGASGFPYAIPISNISWSYGFVSNASGIPNSPIYYNLTSTEVRYALIKLPYYQSMGQSCQNLAARDNVSPAPPGYDINFAVVNCTGSFFWIIVNQNDTTGQDFNSFTIFFGNTSIQGTENSTTLANWRFENQNNNFDLSLPVSSPSALVEQYGLPYTVTLSQNDVNITLATVYFHTPHTNIYPTVGQFYNQTNSTWGLNESYDLCQINNVTPQSTWLYYGYNSSEDNLTIVSSALRAIMGPTPSGSSQPYQLSLYNSTNNAHLSTCLFSALSGLTSASLASNPEEWVSAQFVATNKSTVGNAYAVPAPLITITPSKATIDENQKITLSATVVYGAAPYSYQWILNGKDVGTDSSNFTFNANSTAKYSGTNNVTLSVTDSIGGASSSTVKITAKKDPTIKLTTKYTSTKLDVGQSTSFTANIPSGGFGPFTVNLVLLSNVIATGQSQYGLTNFNYAPSAKGTYTFNVIATDTGTSIPYNFASSAEKITVYSTPVLTLKPSSAKLGSGKEEKYTIKISSGGVGPFTVALYDITNSVQVGTNVIISGSGKSNTISFTTPGPGFYTYEAIATDTGTSYPFGFNSISNTIDVT